MLIRIIIILLVLLNPCVSSATRLILDHAGPFEYTHYTGQLHHVKGGACTKSEAESFGYPGICGSVAPKWSDQYWSCRYKTYTLNGVSHADLVMYPIAGNLSDVQGCVPTCNPDGPERQALNEACQGSQNVAYFDIESCDGYCYSNRCYEIQQARDNACSGIFTNYQCTENEGSYHSDPIRTLSYTVSSRCEDDNCEEMALECANACGGETNVCDFICIDNEITVPCRCCDNCNELALRCQEFCGGAANVADFSCANGQVVNPCECKVVPPDEPPQDNQLNNEYLKQISRNTYNAEKNLVTISSIVRETLKSINEIKNSTLAIKNNTTATNQKLDGLKTNSDAANLSLSGIESNTLAIKNNTTVTNQKLDEINTVPSSSETNSLISQMDQAGQTLLDTTKNNIITTITSNTVTSSLTPSLFDTIKVQLLGIVPESETCEDQIFNYGDVQLNIKCDYFVKVRSALSVLLIFATLWFCFDTAITSLKPRK